jgi:DNA-binding HxlR family transcriptional regulator
MGEEIVLPKEDRVRLVQIVCIKFAVDVLHLLDLNGTVPVRFNAMKRGVGPLSSKTLSATLKALEGKHLVTRKKKTGKGIGNAVEYQLTDKGRALSRAFGSIRDWQGKWGSE